MSDTPDVQSPPLDREVERGEIVDRAGEAPGAPPGEGPGAELEAMGEAIVEPAKVMRIGSMIKQLLEEVRTADLDEASRHRLKEIYDTSVAELAEGMSPDLRDELERLSPPFTSDTPSESELRIAKAQLVGWLEGLFHGIQATLFAQQMAARAQLEEMRHQLPRAASAGDQSGGGTYL